jgi:hypothetical protein
VNTLLAGFRYNDITFSPYDDKFICPRCLGTCNCTHCARVAGLEYVSGVHRTSALGGASASGKPIPRQSRPSAPRRGSRRVRPMRNAPSENLLPWDGPSEAFGIIYGSGGKEIGVGRILVPRRVFIGIPRPEWQVQAVSDSDEIEGAAFVGSGLAFKDPNWRSISSRQSSTSFQSSSELSSLGTTAALATPLPPAFKSHGASEDKNTPLSSMTPLNSSAPKSRYRSEAASTPRTQEIPERTTVSHEDLQNIFTLFQNVPAASECGDTSLKKD